MAHGRQLRRDGRGAEAVLERHHATRRAVGDAEARRVHGVLGTQARRDELDLLDKKVLEERVPDREQIRALVRSKEVWLPWKP